MHFSVYLENISCIHNTYIYNNLGLSSLQLSTALLISYETDEEKILSGTKRTESKKIRKYVIINFNKKSHFQ